MAAGVLRALVRRLSHWLPLSNMQLASNLTSTSICSSEVLSGHTLTTHPLLWRRCGHCRSLAPKWSKVAAALKGVAKVGAINCDEEQQLCSQHGCAAIQSLLFPSMRLHASDAAQCGSANILKDPL